MTRLEFLICVVVVCTQIGNIHGQTCAANECPNVFDPDLILVPDQACYADTTGVTLTCSGTYGGPPGPWTCNSGAWSFPSPSCDVWFCDPPAVASDVTLSPAETNYTTNAVVIYGCPPGETVTGPPSAACEPSGWNPSTIPTCVASCGTPVIYNGNLTSSGPFNEGDTAIAQCYPGYDFGAGDSSTLTCVAGSWDVIPSCYGRCIVDGVPNSDEPATSEITHGSTLGIDCDLGYSYNQQTFFPLTCTDGTLGGTVPTQCFEDCTPLSAPADGASTGGNLHGETTEYTCNRGFMLNETMYETCINGTWSPGESTPTCYDLSLENSISLICNPGYFIVEIPLGLFTNGTADLDSIEMGGCPGTSMDAEYIYLNSSYTACGTTLSVDSANSKLEYENVVTNSDSDVVTTDGAIVVNIKCAFDQDNIVSSSAVVQETLQRSLQSDSQYSLSFGVYADAGYMTPVTGLDTVDTNSDIFLKAQVNKVIDLDLYPSTCYATPTPLSTDTPTYELIRDGEPFVSELATGLSQAVLDGKPTFTFQSKAFRFSSNPSQSIYIHCDLKICPDTTCPLPGGARRRRSIRDTQLTISKHVLAGPIKIRQAREVDAASMWQITALTIYSATLSVFAVCAIGFVGMIVYRRRRSKQNEQI